MNEKKKKYFPMFINLTNKKILVIGAGKIAQRRIKVLISFGAQIRVIAKEATPFIKELSDNGEIILENRLFINGEIGDPYIVLATTDDKETNSMVYEECKSKGILVNVSSDSSLCDFFFPAIIEEDRITIGVCGNGKNHKEVKTTADHLRKFIKGNNNMKKIIIGTRESKLAMTQSNLVAEDIRKHHKIDVELLPMKTTGDIILDKTLDKIGGKGLFVKELDNALVQKKTDISVHSLKDMPMIVPEELPIIAYSKREDPRDVLILPEGCNEIDFTRPIGCSSKRRIIQIKKLFPDAIFKVIRGNVITRLTKLDQGEYGAIVLAAAGLKRLGLEDRISRYFTTEEIIPSAGQGVLAIQGRKDFDTTYVREIDHREARYASLCERSFVRTLDGGCSSPIAAFAEVDGDTIVLNGLYCDEEGQVFIKGKISGNVNDAEKLGFELANKLKSERQG